MLKKKLSLGFIAIIFLIIVFLCIPTDKVEKVLEINTPLDIVLSKGGLKIKNLECFDPKFSEHNKALAKTLCVTEEEAFVIGCLSKYWADDFIKGKSVVVKDGSDVVYLKQSYKNKFKYSGFCIENGKPVLADKFNNILSKIRDGKFIVLDLKTEKFYKISDKEIQNLEDFLIVGKSHKKFFREKEISKEELRLKSTLNLFDVKILLSDLTVNLKPQRDCKDLICKEVLNNINNAKKSIDMAIYGYSGVPEIEKALQNAIARGVKIRLVYDSDSKGVNIYENTERLKTILKNNISDKNSSESGNLMHNKFYIFDNEILMTGSANLSYTDMSGFNSNSVIVIKDSELARIYKKEFEQMFSGRFHNDKVTLRPYDINTNNLKLDVYFSPQDRAVSSAVVPLIKKSTKYIYIPTFVLTHNGVTQELINAKRRGVDVKIIIDALNASGKHSKHQILRDNGIEVKTENYAGKMHSKSMMVDDKYTVIGSMNFSNSGDKRNDENLIVIENSEVTKFYKEFFLYQWNKIDNKWLKYNVRAESKDSIGSCSDGLDNNYDGLIDKADPACR